MVQARLTKGPQPSLQCDGSSEVYCLMSGRQEEKNTVNIITSSRRKKKSRSDVTRNFL